LAPGAVFVEDLPRSKSFYQDVFGLPVAFEDENSAVFNFENTSINLLSVPAAHELIESAAVASREAGSRFQFTAHVDDVDAVCAELARRGVAAAQWADEQATGSPHCQLHRPRRSYLGDRAGPPPGREFIAAYHVHPRRQPPARMR
jgi:catechol 2,3-dioxygenase-like lactoylglutathione lyase family enzyme